MHVANSGASASNPVTLLTSDNDDIDENHLFGRTRSKSGKLSATKRRRELCKSGGEGGETSGMKHEEFSAADAAIATREKRVKKRVDCNKNNCSQESSILV